MRTFVPLDTRDLPSTYDAEASAGQPLVEVKESDKLIELTYRFPGFFRSDLPHDVHGKAMKFETLEVGGLGRTMVSGQPELPTFGRYVQIPPGAAFKVTATTPGEPLEIANISVFPAQAKMVDSGRPHVFEYDAAYYAKDEWLPKEPVTVSGPFFVDGYNALLVHVCPFQFNPKRQTLRAWAEVDVKLALTGGSRAATDAPEGLESPEAFGNLFLNPKRDIGTRVGLPTGPIVAFPLQGPRMLIVYPRKFQQAAENLAAWKNRRGFETELLAYGGPIHDAATLKAELRRRRSLLAARLRYVLLFGDHDDIPVEQDPRTGVHTDYNYSTREDWAGPGHPMPMPWLALGRIPVRNSAEALSVAEQIVTYELAPPADRGYFHRYVVAGHFETSNGRDTRDYVFTMEQIYHYLVSLGLHVERVYTCDTTVRPLFYKNGAAVPPDVLGAILPPAQATQRLVDATNEGQVIIAHRDHGGPSGWVHPPFGLTDLDRVTSRMPSMFYSLNCLTGQFESSGTAECFAEKNLRIPGAAPTLLAATELTNTILNNALMLALFDATFGGLMPTFPPGTIAYPVKWHRIGDLLNYARCYLPIAIGDHPDQILPHHQSYHVLGDPSLEVWTDEPKVLRVHARFVRPRVEVEIDPLAEGTVVTTWRNGEFFKSFTPSSPRFSFTAPPGLPPALGRCWLTVCAWAPGYHFASDRVELPPLAKPVSIEPHPIV